MPQDKKASETQVAWALLTEGVAQARLEVHRLRHLTTRALKLIDASPAKEHFYKEAGDMIMIAPKRIEALEDVLDRTSYALAVLGAEHLRDRLSISDRAVVDDAAHRGKPFGAPTVSRTSARRVAERWMARGRSGD
jgi:hypothetical protein